MLEGKSAAQDTLTEKKSLTLKEMIKKMKCLVDMPACLCYSSPHFPFSWF